MPAHIRLARQFDADAVATIYRPAVEASAISFEATAPDRAEMAHRIAHILPQYPWLVCECGGRVVGYAYASQHAVRAAYRWSVDTTVYVDGAWHRRGVGRGLYESLFAILVAQGYVNAYAGIALPNPASVALHEGVGFSPVGVYSRVGHKLGAWHDVGWWQRPLTRHEASPPEPRDLASVEQAPGFEELLARGVSVVRPEPERV